MRRRLLALLVATLAAGGVLAGPARAVAPPRVVLYGDSLTGEAASYVRGFVRQVAGVESLVRAAPGGATCDLFGEMARDARVLRPHVVVVQFSGNNLTRCMQDAQGRALTGDAWLAKYRADTIHAIRLLRGMRAPIFLATSPVGLVADRTGDDSAHRINAMLRQVAAAHRGVHVADAARSVLAFGTHWTKTLPCLPKEPCAGGVDNNLDRVNHVRALDGVHFCPVPNPTMGSSCPVWSSGAHRFGLGLVVPGLRATGLFDQRRFDASPGAGWRP